MNIDRRPHLDLDAPRALLWLFGLYHLDHPYHPLRKYARKSLRDIRLASVRGGFHKWDVLETLSIDLDPDIERSKALAIECLDAAGAWCVYRALLGAPSGMKPLQPGPSLRGSDMVVRIPNMVPAELRAQAH